MKKKKARNNERYSVQKKKEYEKQRTSSPVEKEEWGESVIRNGYYSGKIKYGYAEQEGNGKGPYNGRDEIYSTQRRKRKRKK